MATVYNLEPQPTAKAILHTTSGPLTLELFAAQTPLTTRNFLQHLLDGYYTNTLFHRLVPGFILQGGDPTGTGHGGQSSYEGGLPFADEFHSRLKFNRRGLLGMANGGSKDDNGSQFFLTLGKAEELNGRHTMFGRVASEDNTIFNLVKMGEAEVEEGTERPLWPTRITGAEVLVNPFEGMVRREHAAVVGNATGQKGEVGKKKVKKGKAGKSLLSFAGGDEDGEDGVVPVKVAKFNPKLVNTVDETDSVLDKSSSSTKRPAPAPPPAERAPKRRAPSLPPSPSAAPSVSAAPKPSTTRARSISSSPSPSPPPAQRNASALAAANAQIAALKASLKRDVPTNTSMSSKPKSALEAMIPATSTRGRKRKGAGAGGAAASREEQEMLDSFNAFRRKLDAVANVKVEAREDADGVPSDRRALSEIDGSGTHASGTATALPQTATDPLLATSADVADDDEAALCDLHFIANCQSCKRWDEGADGGGAESEDRVLGDDAGDSGWLSHRLTFEKDRLGKDLKWKEQNEKELVVIDPRERERELGVRGGREGGRDRGRGEREWDRRDKRGDRKEEREREKDGARRR